MVCLKIKLPSADCDGNEIAIEMHCDAGGDIDQNGQSGANWDLWFSPKTDNRTDEKCGLSTR